MTCPAYGFTATLPPGQEMVTSTAIDVVRDQPELRQRLWDNQRYFVRRMADLNYKLVSTETPIVPIWLGDEAKAEQLARAVREEGIHVDAISFPGVPIKSATYSNPTECRTSPRGNRSFIRGIELGHCDHGNIAVGPGSVLHHHLLAGNSPVSPIGYAEIRQGLGTA